MMTLVERLHDRADLVGYPPVIAGLHREAANRILELEKDVRTRQHQMELMQDLLDDLRAGPFGPAFSL